MLATTATNAEPLDNILPQTAKLKSWIVCLSAAMFFFYEFIQMGMFNSISSELMREFNINAAQLGILSATYFYADVVFLLVAGMLLDRFSTRKIILSAMVLCVSSTLVFALSTSVWVAGISHFIAGIGNAFCFLSCIKLATRWFPSRQLALIMGLMVTLAMAGGVVAQTPLTLLVEAVGWRKAVILDAGLGAVITWLVWYVVYDHPAESGEQSQAHIQSSGNMWKSALPAIKNLQNWFCGLYTCLLNLPIFLLGALWGVMYVTQVHHIPRTEASYITMMVFVGTIIGSPVVGWFSDRIGRRRLPMILGAIISLVIMLAIMYLPNLGFTSLLLLFLGLGFFTSAQIVSYPAIAESNPKNLTGTSTGLASILIMGGGAVFQPLFGWLMDLSGDHHVVDGVTIYSPQDYLLGMAIMPIAFVIGLIASLLIRETRCQPYRGWLCRLWIHQLLEITYLRVAL